MLVAINAMHNNLNRATNQPQMFLSTKNPSQTYSENSFGGINLSRRWEKETGFYKEIKGSYQFARSATEANTRTEQEYFATDAFWQKSYLNQYQNTNQYNKHTMSTGFSMNDKKWGNLIIDYTLSTNHSKQHTLQQITNSIDEIQSTGILQQNGNGKSQEMQGAVSWNKFFGDWNYSVNANYSNSSSNGEENRENKTQNEASGSLQEIIAIPTNGEKIREADELESVEKTEENYRILSDVFSYLGYYTKAYHYLSEVANPQDMKDAKKLYHLKDRLECEGDRYASKRPRKAKDCSIKMPNFKYCSQPLEAGVFEKVDTPEVCDCCGKGTSVIYSGPFYSVEDINVLCPKCIASGKASKRFDGEFVDYAILSSTISEEYKKELCCRTPSYNGWQQEYWPDHCGDFCEFIAYVGWKEIVEMGLENSVEFTSESEGYSEHKEHIINGSSCQGYLFRCLNCKKYILYVDCD